jgi:hypothetical protein
MRRTTDDTLTQQLRKAIDANAMSRYAICKAIGLPESTMSRFMSRHCGLSFKTLDKLGELLGLRLVVEHRTQRGR